MRSFEWLASLAVREVGQRVIEVGCGLGAWTRLLLNREQVVALDTHPTMVAGVLSRFSGSRNLEALTLDVANARFRELARFQPDSVLCGNALAAVRDDERALFNMTTVLPRGGRVVLVLPACPALYCQLDRIEGLQRRYSKESLRTVAERVGLRVRHIRYVNVAGFCGRWWDGLLEKMDAPSPYALRERMVPLLTRLERLVNPPFGENLFAVLELPA
jgi:SAM-dependent methyltransferase